MTKNIKFISYFFVPSIFRANLHLLRTWPDSEPVSYKARDVGVIDNCETNVELFLKLLVTNLGCVDAVTNV